jgi:hypothetical protein
MGSAMETGLGVYIIYQDSDVVEVRVCAWNGKFGGATDAYIGTGDLREAAKKLQGFPTDRSDTREIVFGAFGPDSAGGAVRIRVSCTDASVHLSARVEIESEYDEAGAFESVALVLPIEAAALDGFVAELGGLGTGREEAHLAAGLR